MTVIRMARTSDAKPMEFAFDSAMDAFTLYAMVKESYREDDLVIEMTEEGEHDEQI